MEYLHSTINDILLDVYKAEATAKATAERIAKIHEPVDMDDIQQINMLTDVTIERLEKIDSALQLIEAAARSGE